MRYWLQMLWIYASQRATEMVQFHPFWNRPNESLVGSPMRHHGTPENLEFAVAVTAF